MSFLWLQTSDLEQPRRKLRLWEMREMNYDEAEIQNEAVKKIQQMVRIALGKKYLAIEKVSHPLNVKQNGSSVSRRAISAFVVFERLRSKSIG